MRIITGVIKNKEQRIKMNNKNKTYENVTRDVHHHGFA